MLSFLLITALAVQTPSASKPATTSATRDTTRSAVVSRMVFHDAMRMLWEDHIFFTRNYIVSAAGNLPDTAQVAARLMRNQSDIGDAIKPYYGEAAATQLTALLRSHIGGAARIVAIAKGSSHASTHISQYPTTSRDTSKMHAADTTKNMPAMQSNTSAQSTDTLALNAAIAAWQANSDSLATFLSGANPRNWSRSTLQSALRSHLDMTLKEATAQLHGDFSGSIAAYDDVHQHILQMADVLSEGIMKQFPSRFSAKATTMSSRE